MTTDVRYWRFRGLVRAEGEVGATRLDQTYWHEVVVVTPAELDAIKAEAGAEALRQAANAPGPDLYSDYPRWLRNRAARIARTPDQIGDTP